MNTILAQGFNYDNNYAEQNYSSSTVPVKTQTEVLFTKISIISGTISAFFAVIAAYAIIRMFMIQKHEIEHRDHAVHEYLSKKAYDAKNPRWELIQNLIQSPAEADWRMAIIEADVLLEEALIYAGFTGFGVGEMLTSANPKSFSTYQAAWEAHKVRNDISHMGSTFKLTKEDAIRTLNLYRLVMEEFGII